MPSHEKIHASTNMELVNAIVDQLVKIGWDRSNALSEIADETDGIKQERKELAVERGLSEDATWDEIIAHDERQIIALNKSGGIKATVCWGADEAIKFIESVEKGDI